MYCWALGKACDQLFHDSNKIPVKLSFNWLRCCFKKTLDMFEKLSRLNGENFLPNTLSKWNPFLDNPKNKLFLNCMVSEGEKVTTTKRSEH